MWEFYLAASEMAFREQAMMVIQIQLTKRQGVVPITRDYIAREEARLRALEGGQPPAAAARRRIEPPICCDRRSSTASVNIHASVCNGDSKARPAPSAPRC